jgi:cell wall-associated NlpC family hydrolase
MPGHLPAEAIAVVSATVAAVAAPSADAVAPSPAELLQGLAALRELRDELAGWEPLLIAAARAAGVSWADLAPALGVSSRQAAERRFLRLQPSGAQDRRTGEERVRDERDRRAGDRAVAAWARRNSGSLRQLAGRIGALEGLPAAAQRQVDEVQVALGDDDASALLHPLAEAGSHLTGTHADLAAQVRSVTDQLDQVRRNTHSQRSADAGA